MKNIETIKVKEEHKSKTTKTDKFFGWVGLFYLIIGGYLLIIIDEQNLKIGILGLALLILANIELTRWEIRNK